MPRRPILLALLVAVATTLVVVLIVGTPASGPRVAAGEPAPPISGTTIDGASFDLASLRGRPVIVNFWASWCVPCREEMPLLRDELAAHSADGLAIVGVIFKDQTDPARQFTDSFGVKWPSATDADGSIAKSYRVVAPPQTYFIDRSGVLRSIHIGELQKSDFEAQ